MSELRENSGFKHDIKIFVSHRIDINSELVDNPLYIPMRCGAAFDSENPMKIAGDDTGDNISEKRMSYCEFTVQYWAWKNAEADYYGLCHYRRYLAYDDGKHHAHKDDMMIHEPALCKSSMKKYCISSEEKMREVISEYDAVVSKYIDIRFLPTSDGIRNTTGEMWDSFTGFSYGGRKCSEVVIGLIGELSPGYMDSAISYLNGTKHRGFNCYVMKRELFDKMCRFQFPIIQRISDMLGELSYEERERQIRLPGYVGEMLNGIFIYHLEVQHIYRIKECNIVFFHCTGRLSSGGLAKQRIQFFFVTMFQAMIDLVVPKGSKLRRSIKKYIKIGGAI